MPSNLFLHYNWQSSFNTIDLSGIHNSNAITIRGPTWKQDEFGGYLDVVPGNTLHIRNIPGVTGWRGASISLWVYWEEGGMGFGWAQQPCRFHFRRGTLGWGVGSVSISLPFRQWFHLVITTTNSQASAYVNGVHRGTYSSPWSSSDWYSCSSGVQTFFPLSEITNTYSHSFRGRIRAVQVFRKTLTLSEIQDLDYTSSTGFHGNGTLSLVNSDVQLSSSEFEFTTISVSASTLQSSDVILDNLKTFELFDSSVLFTEETKILSGDLNINLNSSQLYYDASVEISSRVSLVAINSRFQNDVDFSNFQILDLSFSTFESAFYTQVNVYVFYCFNCQLLGNSSLVIEFDCEVNSANFSSQLKFLESVDNSSIIGQVQLSNSIDFFGHMILDDVSISEFQSSSNGSITCHSDVLIKNDVTISKVSFIYHDTLTLYDSTLLFDPFL
ncbi:hypothetical protein GEMRC1_009400 [Eukaryota sp. GEM-RC1]